MSTRKPEAGKPRAKAAAAKKPAPKEKAAPGSRAKKPTSTKPRAAKKPAIPPQRKEAAAERRPSGNISLSGEGITLISNAFTGIRIILEGAAADIRPLDPKRPSGVGIKKQGFIKRAYDLAAENLQFLPQYLTLNKFSDDYRYFVNLRALLEANAQLRELLRNLVVQSADVSYTDAVEFYASVREASKRRIGGAGKIHRDLEKFLSDSAQVKETEEGVPDPESLNNKSAGLKLQAAQTAKVSL
jgi:hypothetical protein